MEQFQTIQRDGVQSFISLPGNQNPPKQRSHTMQIVKFNLLTNNQTQYRSFLFAFQ